MTTVERTSVAPWKRCNFCHDIVFKSPQDFSLHLRNCHCKKEGGSYVCCYGNNNVCSSLPFEGVSDQDYEFHVVKHHVLSLAGDDGSFHEENFVENLRQKYSHIFNAGHSAEQPNVVMDQYQWTIYNSTQNLPAVLNDPRRTKREWDFFIKTWGDSFTENATLPPCPFIPEISWIHFEWYLKQTRKRFRRHARHALAGNTSSERKAVPAINQFLPLCGKQGNSARSTTDLGSGLPQRKTQTQGLEVLAKLLLEHDNHNKREEFNSSASAEIEDVPKIFMQADFNLENPDVFNIVIPWSQLYGHNPSDKILPQRNSVKLLQEKLSHYLDIIEVQIAKQISVRSEAFFHAMTSHDALKDHLTCVIKSVCDLRSRIHVVEEELVTGPMKILKLKRTQRNFLQVYHKLKSMATVHQTQLTIQLLLSRSEFVGALDLIYTTQEVLSQELAGVHSFRHLSSQLAEIEKVIDKMMQTDFVRYVAADLNRPHEEGKLVMEEDRLVAILLGMLRQHQYGFIEIFKDECYTAIKATVKQTVIEVISEFEDVEIESNTGNLSEQVRSLTFLRWIDLLNQVFENMNFLLKRILALYEVIDETTDVAAGKSVSSSSENLQQCPVLHLLEGENEVMIPEKDYISVKSSLKDLLSSVCDHAHECCGKLLSAKSKDDSLDKLSTSEFVLLAQTVESFQTVSGKQRTSLQLLLKSQANKFVNRFHEERKTKLNLILENEQWKQADVPMEFQDLVNHVISSGSLTKQKKSIEDDSSQRKPQQYLFVGEESFAVTGTVLMLLKMMVEYCQCADDVPMVTTDLTVRLLDLLKVFNSRTCQLVLGAGALQLLGLKTITIRHLALASRCLQLIVYFIPHVKRHFQERVSCKQQNPIKHFDQIFKDYNDHIEEISLKVESIVSNMFEAQLRKWEVKAPVPSPCFTAISKQLNRAHELVHDLLPPVQLQDIFVKAHNTFIEKLSCHLDRLKVKNDGGPQHGLVVQELTFYTQNLKKLKVPCDYNMNDLWNAR